MIELDDVKYSSEEEDNEPSSLPFCVNKLVASKEFRASLAVILFSYERVLDSSKRTNPISTKEQENCLEILKIILENIYGEGVITPEEAFNISLAKVRKENNQPYEESDYQLFQAASTKRHIVRWQEQEGNKKKELKSLEDYKSLIAYYKEQEQDVERYIPNDILEKAAKAEETNLETYQQETLTFLKIFEEKEYPQGFEGFLSLTFEHLVISLAKMIEKSDKIDCLGRIYPTSDNNEQFILFPLPYYPKHLLDHKYNNRRVYFTMQESLDIYHLIKVCYGYEESDKQQKLNTCFDNVIKNSVLNEALFALYHQENSQNLIDYKVSLSGYIEFLENIQDSKLFPYLLEEQQTKLLQLIPFLIVRCNDIGNGITRMYRMVFLKSSKSGEDTPQEYDTAHMITRGFVDDSLPHVKQCMLDHLSKAPISRAGTPISHGGPLTRRDGESELSRIEENNIDDDEGINPFDRYTESLSPSSFADKNDIIKRPVAEHLIQQQLKFSPITNPSRAEGNELESDFSSVTHSNESKGMKVETYTQTTPHLRGEEKQLLVQDSLDLNSVSNEHSSTSPNSIAFESDRSESKEISIIASSNLGLSDNESEQEIFELLKTTEDSSIAPDESEPSDDQLEENILNLSLNNTQNPTQNAKLAALNARIANGTYWNLVDAFIKAIQNSKKLYYTNIVKIGLLLTNPEVLKKIEENLHKEELSTQSLQSFGFQKLQEILASQEPDDNRTPSSVKLSIDKKISSLQAKLYQLEESIRNDKNIKEKSHKLRLEENTKLERLLSYHLITNYKNIRKGSSLEPDKGIFHPAKRIKHNGKICHRDYLAVGKYREEASDLVAQHVASSASFITIYAIVREVIIIKYLNGFSRLQANQKVNLKTLAEKPLLIRKNNNINKERSHSPIIEEFPSANIDSTVNRKADEPFHSPHSPIRKDREQNNSFFDDEQEAHTLCNNLEKNYVNNSIDVKSAYQARNTPTKQTKSSRAKKQGVSEEGTYLMGLYKEKAIYQINQIRHILHEQDINALSLSLALGNIERSIKGSLPTPLILDEIIYDAAISLQRAQVNDSKLKNLIWRNISFALFVDTLQAYQDPTQKNIKAALDEVQENIKTYKIRIEPKYKNIFNLARTKVARSLQSLSPFLYEMEDHAIQKQISDQKYWTESKRKLCQPFKENPQDASQDNLAKVIKHLSSPAALILLEENQQTLSPAQLNDIYLNSHVLCEVEKRALRKAHAEIQNREEELIAKYHHSQEDQPMEGARQYKDKLEKKLEKKIANIAQKIIQKKMDYDIQSVVEIIMSTINDRLENIRSHDYTLKRFIYVLPEKFSTEHIDQELIKTVRKTTEGHSNKIITEILIFEKICSECNLEPGPELEAIEPNFSNQTQSFSLNESHNGHQSFLNQSSDYNLNTSNGSLSYSLSNQESPSYKRASSPVRHNRSSYYAPREQYSSQRSVGSCGSEQTRNSSTNRSYNSYNSTKSWQNFCNNNKKIPNRFDYQSDRSYGSHSAATSFRSNSSIVVHPKPFRI